MCGSFLKSNMMYYLLFCEGVGILEGPELFFSAGRGVCLEYLCRWEASCLIGDTQPWFGSLSNEGMYKIHNACRCCKTDKGLMIPE